MRRRKKDREKSNKYNFDFYKLARWFLYTISCLDRKKLFHVILFPAIIDEIKICFFPDIFVEENM